MFSRVDKNGKPYRYTKAVCDCSKDEPITEQSHKKEVDINNIIKRHGMDMIQKTAMLQQQDYMFDDIPGNDFQEAMNIVNRAQAAFDSLPSLIRKEFDNNPAMYLDFVQNPDNADRMVELGLAEKPAVQEPVQVVVTNEPVQQVSETPPV